MVAGVVAFFRTADGSTALDNFSAAQGVELSYNDDGQLIDRGTTEGAAAIMTLLTDDWGYPVVDSQLDPNDPLVNTPSEYMFQMATIGYHVLHGNQTITLTEDVEYNGELFTAGTYEHAVDGKYWTDFDRQHPIEGPARAAAWSGTVHGLFGELGVGAAVQTTIQVGYALAGILAGLGGTLILAGFGLVWVGKDSFASLVESGPDRHEEGGCLTTRSSRTPSKGPGQKPGALSRE